MKEKPAVVIDTKDMGTGDIEKFSLSGIIRKSDMEELINQKNLSEQQVKALQTELDACKRRIETYEAMIKELGK